MYKSFTFYQLILQFPHIKKFENSDPIRELDPLLNFLGGLLIRNLDGTIFHRFDHMFFIGTTAKFVFKRTHDYDIKNPEHATVDASYDKSRIGEQPLSNMPKSEATSPINRTC